MALESTADVGDDACTVPVPRVEKRAIQSGMSGAHKNASRGAYNRSALSHKDRLPTVADALDEAEAADTAAEAASSAAVGATIMMDQYTSVPSSVSEWRRMIRRRVDSGQKSERKH